MQSRAALHAASTTCRRLIPASQALFACMATSSSSPGPPAQVAVVGGGLAGLSAAGRLAELGLSPTLFDMGTRAPGGRACSRAVPQARLTFDHGCQFLAPASDEFASAVRAWAAAGAAVEWAGALGELDPGSGTFRERERSGNAAVDSHPGFCGLMSAPGPVYRGQPGMGAVAQLLAQRLLQAGGVIVQGQRVSQSSFILAF